MYNDFSSLPPDQEREFIVYEQRTRESEKSAFRTGAIVAGLYGLLMVIIVVSYDKPPPLIGEEDITVSEEKRRVNPEVAADEETPDLAPAPTPGETPPAPEGGEAAGGEVAPADDAPVAPPPAAGATKASPTDLVKANQ